MKAGRRQDLANPALPMPIACAIGEAMTDDWPDLAGRLAGDAHHLGLRVYYEDTDFSGVVYHASYLRFMERGRTDLLRLRGVGHAELAEDGLAFVVRRMTLDFARPARIDDALVVETCVSGIRGASLTLDQTVRRADLALVTADVTVALVDREGRPRRWPSAIRARLAPAPDA